MEIRTASDHLDRESRSHYAVVEEPRVLEVDRSCPHLRDCRRRLKRKLVRLGREVVGSSINGLEAPGLVVRLPSEVSPGGDSHCFGRGSCCKSFGQERRSIPRLVS